MYMKPPMIKILVITITTILTEQNAKSNMLKTKQKKNYKTKQNKGLFQTMHTMSMVSSTVLKSFALFPTLTIDHDYLLTSLGIDILNLSSHCI